MAVFESGAKSSEEKPRYDLIPHVALEREGVRMAEGAKAHGENNYRIGVNDPQFIKDRINHMIEHALKYADGDRSEDHLAGVRCNAGMLMWIEANRGKTRELVVTLPPMSFAGPFMSAIEELSPTQCARAEYSAEPKMVEVSPNAWVLQR